MTQVEPAIRRPAAVPPLAAAMPRSASGRGNAFLAEQAARAKASGPAPEPAPFDARRWLAGFGDLLGDAFDLRDHEDVPKRGGVQIGAMHEAGHMLGLADEYGSGTPSHSALVQRDLGHVVARGEDGRIMSGGMDVQPEHGVTFLEALRAATGKAWGFTPKPPRVNPFAQAAAAPFGSVSRG